MSSSLFSESINWLALNVKVHTGTLKKSSNHVNHFAHRQPPRPFDCALPNQSNPPARNTEFCLIPQISEHIAADFLSPEPVPGFGPMKLRAIMPVPEAAVHKQNRTEFRKHKIRLSGQLPVVQPIPETAPVQQLADSTMRSLGELASAAPEVRFPDPVASLGPGSAARPDAAAVTGQAALAADAKPVRVSRVTTGTSRSAERPPIS